MIYLNEFDPNAAEWLAVLMDDGLIPKGHIDTRSIADVTPVDLMGYTQCHFFSGIGGWCEALRIAGWPEDRPVWTGSCPCFPAGTLVMTANGYKGIEHVVAGDQVLTHKGRFMPVTHVGSEHSECVTVKGQGHFGLTCTPDHPFYVNNGDGPKWASAKDLKGQRWATIASVPPLLMPEPVSAQTGVFFDTELGKFRAKGEKAGRSVHLGVFDSIAEGVAARTLAIRSERIDVRGANGINVKCLGFARFLGYWIGDGWVSGGKVYLCGSVDDCTLLNDLFTAAGLSSKAYLERTSSRICCGSKHLVAWLKEHFGQYSDGKRIPVWLHGMSEEYRAAFLDGYELADGHKETQTNGRGQNRIFTTASRSLAIGVRVLLNQAGRSASIRVHKNNRIAIIEGRTVSELPSFRVTSYESARSFQFAGQHGWGLVRSVKPAGIHRVYNIAVEEDESYTADGIVVHNCQPYSTAGKQKGNADERHLWPEFFRLIRECRPATIFGEQVGSAIRHGWLDGVFTDLEGIGYSCGAACLPACGVGSPHKRQRLWFVANPDGWDTGTEWEQRGGEQRQQQANGRAGVTQGDTSIAGLEAHAGHGGNGNQPGRLDTIADGHAATAGCVGFWNDYELVYCRDGKSRRIEPGVSPLVAGLPRGVVHGGDQSAPVTEEEAQASAEGRVMRLKGYGNSIVPQEAARFIQAFMEAQK